MNATPNLVFFGQKVASLNKLLTKFLLNRLEQAKKDITVLIKDRILDHKRDSLEFRLFLY